jgi:hypothetical protein
MTVQNSEQYKPANSDTQSSLPAQFFFTFPIVCLCFRLLPLRFLFFSFSARLLALLRVSVIRDHHLFYSPKVPSHSARAAKAGCRRRARTIEERADLVNAN